MAFVVSAQYEGRSHLLPCEAGESVAALRSTLSEAVGVPARDLSLRARAGAELLDGRALAEYGLGGGGDVSAARVTTARAVAGAAVASVLAALPSALFWLAIPTLLWFGLRRRGLPLSAVVSGLRLPFAE